VGDAGLDPPHAVTVRRQRNTHTALMEAIIAGLLPGGSLKGGPAAFARSASASLAGALAELGWAQPPGLEKTAGRERRVGNRPGTAWEERLTWVVTMSFQKPNKWNTQGL
jgi:hypothetical protein